MSFVNLVDVAQEHEGFDDVMIPLVSATHQLASTFFVFCEREGEETSAEFCATGHNCCLHSCSNQMMWKVRAVECILCIGLISEG